MNRQADVQPGGVVVLFPQTSGVTNVKRVNLVEYFELTEALSRARASVRVEKSKAGNIYFGTAPLPQMLRKFVDADNGFETCKHAARELVDAIDAFSNKHLLDDASPPGYDVEKFDVEIGSWAYSSIGTRIDTFRSVWNTECNEVEIYSVGQISIYRTQALVSKASARVPAECAAWMPPAAMDEFNSAGKCLAFDLPTACGFHALRAVELMILEYLTKFGAKTQKLHTWNDYVKAVQKLVEAPDADQPEKPSAKVATMVDRMRELDRNPLMHPRDTLDTTAADLLFTLAAITATEMARDLKRKKGHLKPALIAAPKVGGIAVAFDPKKALA
jgi:hypothetical protein